VFTVSQARKVQSDLGLSNVHVAWFDPELGFSLAHSQEERDMGTDLHECLIHLWFSGGCGNTSCCMLVTGWYVVSGLHDVKGLAL
jgi:hypothetical protein